jgi:hypothetical protein
MTTPDSTLGYEDNEPTSRDYEKSDVKTRPLNVMDSRPEEQAQEPSYIHQDAQAEMNARWKEVQTEFVDDPRKSVAHAHQLVSDAVQRIVDTFTEERNQLERQWSEGEDVSTEELRVCLQRYRAFFTRLLPLEAARS